MKPIKLAIIGAGLMGQKHAEIISDSSECELAAICDTNPEGAAVADRYGVSFYQDYHALLAEQTLEGAIIATPTNLHAPVGITCAEHGVHILVEKPIAGTLVDATALLEAVEHHSIQLLVGHHRRHNPLIQQARAIIQGGQIGELVGATAIFAVLKPPDYYDVAWRIQPGGGPIMINLIHDIDSLRFICGEIESVYAVTSSKTRGFAVEDTASLSLQFANGAVGSVFVSDATPAPWSYELTSGENPIYPRQAQDCYHFCGTAGSLAFPSLRLWRYADPNVAGWWQPLQEQKIAVHSAGNALATQLTHFCQVIRREATPLVTGADGLKTLAAIQAIIESGKHNTPIRPDL